MHWACKARRLLVLPSCETQSLNPHKTPGGIDKHKLHIGLDGLALDIKIYRDDLQALTQQDWVFDGVTAVPDGENPEPFVLGDGVRAQVAASGASDALGEGNTANNKHQTQSVKPRKQLT